MQLGSIEDMFNETLKEKLKNIIQQLSLEGLQLSIYIKN
jgi:hypothetical protein